MQQAIDVSNCLHGNHLHEEPNTGFLSCVADVDPPSEHVVGDEDQQTEIAIRKEFQRLQQEEDMRKGDFSGVGSRYGYIRFVGPALRLPKEVRNQLAKLHGNFAHPSNERLARMLQINGASKAIIEGAKCIRCSRVREGIGSSISTADDSQGSNTIQSTVFIRQFLRL